MTLFDVIAAIVLLVSALIGFSRGAVREMINVAAFLLATLGAAYLLRFTGPPARAMVHPTWAATAMPARNFNTMKMIRKVTTRATAVAAQVGWTIARAGGPVNRNR